MKVFAVINEKGGVGKTTTAAAVGEGMALAGMKVLFVDMDGQANLTYAMRAEITPINNTYGIMERPARARQSVQHTARGDIIGGHPALAFAEVQGGRREYRLKEALGYLAADYEVCMIDCPPALSVLTINALTAADAVIIPALADAFSLYGLGQIKATIESVRENGNAALGVDGILLTHYTPRQILARSAEKAIEKKAEDMGGRLYKSRIRECVALKEAQMKGQSIYTYAPKSHAAKDYAALVKEIMA